VLSASWCVMTWLCSWEVSFIGNGSLHNHGFTTQWPFVMGLSRGADDSSYSSCLIKMHKPCFIIFIQVGLSVGV
jgi:hypothetical protein